MKKVNMHEAIKTARMTAFDSETTTETTVATANLWLTGNLLRAISDEHGVVSDRYFDAVLLEHFAQSMESLEKIVDSENLKDDDKVKVTYNHEMDIWEFN